MILVPFDGGLMDLASMLVEMEVAKAQLRADAGSDVVVRLGSKARLNEACQRHSPRLI
jgi:hypothetical protein